MATDDNTHTRGAVKDPAHDGRLKENRDSGSAKETRHSDRGHSGEGHSSGQVQGAVKDPAHDGRLKENREKGIHKGGA